MNAKRFGLKLAMIGMLAMGTLSMVGQTYASDVPGTKDVAPAAPCGTTLTLNPDADTTLYQGGGVVGAGGFRYFTVQNPGPERRALIHFNLAALPSSVQVCDARLLLNMFSASGAPVENISAQYIMAPWAEAGAVWPGPAIGPVVNTTPVGLANGWYAWSVTNAVSNWKSGALANNGFAMTGQPGALSTRVFYSREMLPVGLQPQLVIRY